MIRCTSILKGSEPPHEVNEMKMPLGMLPEGARARVVEVYAGRGLSRRLAEMGFNIGEMVTIIHNHNHGPVMIEVRDARVALGRGVALKIMVEEV